MPNYVIVMITTLALLAVVVLAGNAVVMLLLARAVQQKRTLDAQPNRAAPAMDEPAEPEKPLRHVDRSSHDLSLPFWVMTSGEGKRTLWAGAFETELHATEFAKDLTDRDGVTYAVIEPKMWGVSVQLDREEEATVLREGYRINGGPLMEFENALKKAVESI